MRTSPMVAVGAALFLLTSCANDPQASPSPTSELPLLDTVTVVTHDSFAVPDEVLAAFEEEHNITVQFVAPGDAGSLVNQLILTKDAPLGDVVYGVDNTFASRAVAEGVFTPYTSQAPAASDAALYAVMDSSVLTAIDFSDVCINADLTWFDARGITPPTTIADLADPTYAGLLSVPNPATSSPGLAFLLATIAADQDGWPELWESLRANDVRVTAGWSESYFSDFSAPSTGGDYPLVVSYASSPPFEVGEDGVAPTAALLDTCLRQVEYAGVLAGAANPAGAHLVIDWMLSDDFQASLPESMYVYPVSSSVTVPDSWAAHAPLATDPLWLDPQVIDTNREAWIEQWTSIVID